MKNNYVNNKEFYKLIEIYKKTGSRKAYDKIGKIFYEISTNFLNKGKFSGYSQDRKDEMVSDATFFMLKYIDNYNLEQKNPFAYFTTFALNAFLQNISKYKKSKERYVSLDFNENVEYKEQTAE